MRVRIQDDAGHFRSWEVADQTNLFVEVVHENKAPTYLGSLWFDQRGRDWDVMWGTSNNEGQWWDAINPVTYHAERADRGPMTKILIFAWDGDSSGFDWEPVHDRTGVRLIRDRYHTFTARPELVGTSSNFVLAELDVAGYAPDAAGRQRITDLIEGELQDSIALGHLGHIVARYTLEGA